MRHTLANRLRIVCHAAVGASLLKFSAAVAILCCAACNKSQPVQDRNSSRAPDTELQSDRPAVAGPAKPSAPSHGAVKAEFRNVMFHLTRNAAAHLETVSGELRPAGPYDIPVFDDKTSFEVHVSNGMVSIAPEALAAIMNEYVFVRHDSPMKDISIKVKEGRLLIKGKLHSKGDLPFETGGELTVNADGRLRLHSEKVKALHVPVKKVMSLIGIELANVINTSKIPGMDTDKNDLIFDLGDLLPPPHIRGKITTARLGRNEITVVYGSAEAAANGGEKCDALSRNYMAFRGNRVKFGKLTMENSDLTVIDLDARDPLDWNQDSYQDQLIAGYSKTTEQFGLCVYVKDFAKLPKSPKGASPANTKTGQQ